MSLPSVYAQHAVPTELKRFYSSQAIADMSNIRWHTIICPSAATFLPLDCSFGKTEKKAN
jgi:hypothetical protein